MSAKSQKDQEQDRMRAVRMKQEARFGRSEVERSAMEVAAARKVWIWAVGQGLKTFFRINEESSLSSFQVTLYRSLPLSEIRKRIEKAFEDL